MAKCLPGFESPPPHMEIEGKPSEVWKQLFGKHNPAVACLDKHLGNVKIKVSPHPEDAKGARRILYALLHIPEIYRVEDDRGWINSLYPDVVKQRAVFEVFTRMLAKKTGIDIYVEDVFARLAWKYVNNRKFPRGVPESSRVSRSELERMKKIIQSVFRTFT